MRFWTFFILSISLFVFSGCSEATKNQVSPNPSLSIKKYQLKIVRVDKRLPINKNVINIDFQTLKSISKLNDAKQLSIESRVLDILENINIKESLNLKTINYELKSAKFIKNEIVVVGYSNNSFGGGYDGYILFFDKDSLDVKRMILFKNKQLFDISSDMEKVLVNEVKNKKNYIKIYSFNSAQFTNIDEIKQDIDWCVLKFSPKNSYIVETFKFQKSDEDNVIINIYDTKTVRKLFTDSMYFDDDFSLKFVFSFSSNEKYLLLSKVGKKNKYNIADLYKTSDFTSVLNFEENKSGNVDFGWESFILSDNYLLFIDKSEVYSLKTMRLVDKKDFGFVSHSIVDKENDNIFYLIDDKEIDIFYIKDDNAYLLKSLPKIESFTKESIIYNHKIYLLPNYKERFSIVDIPALNIDNYNFALAKQLKKAKKFYRAGFKVKSIEMYKNLVSDRNFNQYFKLPRYVSYVPINAMVDLQRYKLNNDVDSLLKYIISALDHNYIDEAIKGLGALKKTTNQKLYTVLNAMFLAQVGKEKQAYSDLVDNMPYSQKIVDLIEKNSNSSLKLYKDNTKLSVIFGISESKIKYIKASVGSDFISFEGDLIHPNSKKTKKTKKTKVFSSKQNAIKLLD